MCVLVHRYCTPPSSPLPSVSLSVVTEKGGLLSVWLYNIISASAFVPVFVTTEREKRQRDEGKEALPRSASQCFSLSFVTTKGVHCVCLYSEGSASTSLLKKTERTKGNKETFPPFSLCFSVSVFLS